MHGVAAILLAAGRSSRMGQCKALLPFGSGTVIDACISALEAAGIEAIVVVTGAHAPEISNHLAGRKLEVVLNPIRDSEMGASIARGMQRLGPDIGAVMIALADQPAIAAAVMVQMIQKWKETNALLVVPRFNGKQGHPLLVDMKLRNELLDLPADRGLKSLLERYSLQIACVDVDSQFVLRDMDTRDDYCRLHLEVFGKEAS